MHGFDWSPNWTAKPLKSFLDSYLVMMGHKVPKKDDHSLHSAFCQQLVCSTMSISA